MYAKVTASQTGTFLRHSDKCVIWIVRINSSNMSKQQETEFTNYYQIFHQSSVKIIDVARLSLYRWCISVLPACINCLFVWSSLLLTEQFSFHKFVAFYKNSHNFCMHRTLQYVRNSCFAQWSTYNSHDFRFGLSASEWATGQRLDDQWTTDRERCSNVRYGDRRYENRPSSPPNSY